MKWIKSIKTFIQTHKGNFVEEVFIDRKHQYKVKSRRRKVEKCSTKENKTILERRTCINRLFSSFSCRVHIVKNLRKAWGGSHIELLLFTYCFFFLVQSRLQSRSTMIHIDEKDPVGGKSKRTKRNSFLKIVSHIEYIILSVYWNKKIKLL